MKLEIRSRSANENKADGCWRRAREFKKLFRRACDLGRRDLLFVVHSEEEIALETVAPMTAPASPIVMNFRILRQPHVQIAGSEMHWTIFDGCVVSNQADLWQRVDEIRFQPDDLKAVCCNPRAPLESNRVGLAFSTNLVGANGIRFVGPLAEIHLPGRPALRTRLSLTRDTKVMHIVWMKDKYQCRQPRCSYTIGKSNRKIMRVPVFING